MGGQTRRSSVLAGADMRCCAPLTAVGGDRGVKHSTAAESSFTFWRRSTALPRGKLLSSRDIPSAAAAMVIPSTSTSAQRRSHRHPPSLFRLRPTTFLCPAPCLRSAERLLFFSFSLFDIPERKYLDSYIRNDIAVLKEVARFTPPARTRKRKRERALFILRKYGVIPITERG